MGEIKLLVFIRKGGKSACHLKIEAMWQPRFEMPSNLPLKGSLISVEAVYSCLLEPSRNLKHPNAGATSHVQYRSWPSGKGGKIIGSGGGKKEPMLPC